MRSVKRIYVEKFNLLCITVKLTPVVNITRVTVVIQEL